MKTRVQRWGNSLAIRIPRTYAADMHLEENMTVEITKQDDRLIIAPVSTAQWTLEVLLVGITSDNIHHETGTGPAVGNEEW